MYWAAGVLPCLIRLINSIVIFVFTEMSTGVHTIFFQGARKTIWAASGSNHILNSCRGVFANSGSSVWGFRLAHMKIHSLESLGNSGSIEMASERFVNGPPS